MGRRDEHRQQRRRHPQDAPGEHLPDADAPLPEGRERGQRDRDGGERPVELRAGGQPGQCRGGHERSPARPLVRTDGGGDARHHPERQGDVGDREVTVPDVERHDREERGAEERRGPGGSDPPQQEIEQGYRRRAE